MQLGQLVKRWMPGRSYLGLEINDSSVKATEISVAGDGSFQIHHAASTRLRPQAVEEGRIKDRAAVMQAVIKTLASAPFKAKQVHFVLPSPIVMVRYMKLPDLSLADLQKLVAFEVKHQIHLPFEDPYFDFIKLNGSEQGITKKVTQIKSKRGPEKEQEEQGWSEAASASESAHTSDLLFGDKPDAEQAAKTDPAVQCDVMLVIAPRTAVEEYASILRECQLIPYSIEIKGLALYRLIGVLYPEIHTTGTYLAVDLNETSADVSIFDHGQMRITRSTAVSFKTDTITVPKPPEPVSDGLFNEFEVIETLPSGFELACGEFASELDRIINFFRYSLNNRTKEIDRVIVTGDIARLSDVVAELQQRMTPTVEMMRPLPHTSVFVPDFAVPIGLGLRGNAR
jgi:type IV pilus assembly protein PilM